MFRAAVFLLVGVLMSSSSAQATNGTAGAGLPSPVPGEASKSGMAPPIGGLGGAPGLPSSLSSPSLAGAASGAVSVAAGAATQPISGNGSAQASPSPASLSSISGGAPGALPGAAAPGGVPPAPPRPLFGPGSQTGSGSIPPPMGGSGSPASAAAGGPMPSLLSSGVVGSLPSKDQRPFEGSDGRNPNPDSGDNIFRKIPTQASPVTLSNKDGPYTGEPRLQQANKRR